MMAAKFASSELDVSKTELEHMAVAFVWHSERRGVPGSLNHNHCTARAILSVTSGHIGHKFNSIRLKYESSRNCESHRPASAVNQKEAHTAVGSRKLM